MVAMGAAHWHASRIVLHIFALVAFVGTM